MAPPKKPEIPPASQSSRGQRRPNMAHQQQIRAGRRVSLASPRERDEMYPSLLK